MSFTVIAIFIGLFIVLGFWYIKFEHHTKKVKIIAILLFVLLLYFSVASVFTRDEVDLSSPGGVVNAVYVYFGWIGRTVSNLWDVGMDTTGNVVKAVKLNDSIGDISNR